EDFAAGLRYQLPVENPVDVDGRFFQKIPLVGGLTVWQANDVVIEALKEHQRLLRIESYQHSYPHCWRHKTPLIFRATRQWFISMDGKGLRGDALKGIAATQWIPAWGQARIGEMVAGRPDWCISRQRYWGVPLALFIDKQSGELHPQMATLLRKVADKVQKEGLEAW